MITTANTRYIDGFCNPVRRNSTLDYVGLTDDGNHGHMVHLCVV